MSRLMSVAPTTPTSGGSTPGRLVWLWLLVLFVGVQFGAGLYEKLAIVPMWASAPPGEVLAAMRETGMWRAGRAFWPFVSPVVALLAIGNLIVARRSVAPMRRWWLAAATLMVTYAAGSYGYFVPQMLNFQASGADWTAEQVETFITWWTGLNWLRMAIGLAGWLCAVRALSLSAAPAPAVAGRPGGRRYHGQVLRTEKG